ncbi:putative meiotic nuclear division 5-like protein A [Operophtera brumata]|uniref:Putative meiotic nuclear division 5-like protein A n=1 Tax=Operophtera brumata TaxID=104452 RepID=A0A0L7LHD7_OPEBR|nr:putative meiotic nuclear division 5-like protein A [Operophtera brumata]
MDSCTGVEQDLDKALAKFSSLNDNANRMLQDVIDQVESLRREISNQPPNSPLSEPQSILVSDVANTIKQSNIESYTPPFQEWASQVTGVERACTFAILQRCAAALLEGDPSMALEWVEKRADQLTHSPLPFALHRMQALKVPNLPSSLHFLKELTRENNQFFSCLLLGLCRLIWEACSLLRLAPLSPLAGAVAAGCKVLPALHDIRAKMSHPHVIAAWSDDELPFEVSQ